MVLAGGLGFEPRLTESESVVLPLDDPPSGAGMGRRPGASGGRILVGMPAAFQEGPRRNAPGRRAKCVKGPIPCLSVRCLAVGRASRR